MWFESGLLVWFGPDLGGGLVSVSDLVLSGPELGPGRDPGLVLVWVLVWSQSRSWSRPGLALV